MASTRTIRLHRRATAASGGPTAERFCGCRRINSQLAERVSAGRSRLLNGHRRQNLLLLSREPAQADELHAPDPAEGAQPVVAVRGGWHWVRLVHTVSQADFRTGAVGR